MPQLEKEFEKLRLLIDSLYPGEKKTLVNGEGRQDASVMLIGEAPGEKETLEGRPFVGKAGANLNAFLDMSGLTREDMYVTNTVKFRPTKASAKGRLSNRPPTKEEIRLCRDYLLLEIETIRPKWIVTLGNTPLQALLGSKETVGNVHGQPRAWQGHTLYPMYHPASLIYNPSLAEDYRSDILRLSELVKE